MAMIELDGSSLTLEQLVAIADGGETVTLSSAAAERVRASRAVVDRRAQSDEPAYGINTGFGSFADVRIPREALEELQLNLLRSHAAGVGDPLPPRVVRAMMALRANVLAKGFSGIRVETLEARIDSSVRSAHSRGPSVPRTGAVRREHRAVDARQRHQQVARALRQGPGRVLPALRGPGARRDARGAALRAPNRADRSQRRDRQP